MKSKKELRYLCLSARHGGCRIVRRRHRSAVFHFAPNAGLSSVKRDAVEKIFFKANGANKSIVFWLSRWRHLPLPPPSILSKITGIVCGRRCATRGSLESPTSRLNTSFGSSFRPSSSGPSSTSLSFCHAVSPGFKVRASICKSSSFCGEPPISFLRSSFFREALMALGAISTTVMSLHNSCIPMLLPFVRIINADLKPSTLSSLLPCPLSNVSSSNLSI